MNKGFGGKQAHMHKSTITSKDGFIGPFARTLKFGDKQDFIFKKRQGALLDVIFGTTEPLLGSQDRKQKKQKYYQSEKLWQK